MSEPLPIAYRIPDALRVLPIGRTTLFELLKTGEIESFTIGAARLIPHESLVAFMRQRMDTSPCEAGPAEHRPGPALVDAAAAARRAS